MVKCVKAPSRVYQVRARVRVTVTVTVGLLLVLGLGLGFLQRIVLGSWVGLRFVLG